MAERTTPPVRKWQPKIQEELQDRKWNPMNPTAPIFIPAKRDNQVRFLEWPEPDEKQVKTYLEAARRGLLEEEKVGGEDQTPSIEEDIALHRPYDYYETSRGFIVPAPGDRPSKDIALRAVKKLVKDFT